MVRESELRIKHGTEVTQLSHLLINWHITLPDDARFKYNSGFRSIRRTFNTSTLSYGGDTSFILIGNLRIQACF